MQKMPHSWPRLPRTGTLCILFSRSTATFLGCFRPLPPIPPPRCWPFASLLAARFRQPLATLLFHGLHGGQASCEAPLPRPMTGQGRRPAAAVAWPQRHTRAPERHRIAVVGQPASAGLPRTRPVATDATRATSAFTAAAGGASSLEDGCVLQAAPVARPGGGATPRCGRVMDGAGPASTGAACAPGSTGWTPAAGASGAGASRGRGLAPAARPVDGMPVDGMPPWSRRGTATAAAAGTKRTTTTW